MVFELRSSQILLFDSGDVTFQKALLVVSRRFYVRQMAAIREEEEAKLECEGCCVCLEDHVHQLVYTPCVHAICVTCVQEWVQRDESCPMCRQSLTPSFCKRILAIPSHPPKPKNKLPEYVAASVPTPLVAPDYCSSVPRLSARERAENHKKASLLNYWMCQMSPHLEHAIEYPDKSSDHRS